MNKSYHQIIEDKDIEKALEYLEPRQTTYKSTQMIRMVINELKDKGIIKKTWWEEYAEKINTEVQDNEKLD